MTGVQINELMKLPGITSNLRGLMQCLVHMLYIIRQLAVLEKEKSLEPFNPTCIFEEKKMCQWNLLSSLTALILRFSSSVDTANPISL